MFSGRPSGRPSLVGPSVRSLSFCLFLYLVEGFRRNWEYDHCACDVLYIIVSEQALSTSDNRTVDVIKDVRDNNDDSLRRVFHALKIEPCRLRLVSKSPTLRGKNKPNSSYDISIYEDSLVNRGN